MEEIKRAAIELGGDKAPGLDGFLLHFFKHFWDLLKGDLEKLCEDFYWGKGNLKRINWASIVLIPKCATLERLGDY